MNDKRRKSIRTAIEHLNRASVIIDQVSDEESDALDNIPENLQDSDRYVAMEDAIESLSDADEAVNDAIEKLEQSIR
jgi:poly-gamma-glutamate capsule biosynthesis protein CapA/YwtB (metallophosphatase superfamily)